MHCAISLSVLDSFNIVKSVFIPFFIQSVGHNSFIFIELCLNRTQSSANGFTAFDDNLIQRTRFGARKNIPARFQVQSAVPAVEERVPASAPATVSSVDRFQTAFTTTPAPPQPRFQSTTPQPTFQQFQSPAATPQAAFNQQFQNQPSSRLQTPAQRPGQQSSRFQPTLVQVERTGSRQTAVLPDVTTPTRLPPTSFPRRQNVNRDQAEGLQTNSVATVPARQRVVQEQPRSQNIFSSTVPVDNSRFEEARLLSPNSVASSPVISQKVPFNSDQTVKAFRNFQFEALPNRFSSSQQTSDQFYFGPPSQTINMRDGSYTIITVLSWVSEIF